jgi:hypothetical protein
VGCGNAIRFTSEYDLKKIISLLMTIFERLNLSIQAKLVVLIDGLFVEKEEKTNMFGVGASVKESSQQWLLGNYFCFEGWLYLHQCVQIHLFGGKPMRVNFRMLVSLVSKLLRFQGFKLGLKECST